MVTAGYKARNLLVMLSSAVRRILKMMKQGWSWDSDKDLLKKEKEKTENRRDTQVCMARCVTDILTRVSRVRPLYKVRS